MLLYLQFIGDRKRAAIRRPFLVKKIDSDDNINLNPARVIVLIYLALILAGALLLKAPLSAKNGESVSFLAALFTSTSASCVTGLSSVDFAETWSVFGKAVILFLIQIGGLGFMSVTTVYFFILHKKIGLSQRLLLAQSMNVKELDGVVRLIRHVLFGTLMFESAGALAMSTRFVPEFGLWKGLGLSVYQSISAFCNAGFEILGENESLSSLSLYTGDTVVSLSIAVLVVIGGLGFFVWEDIWRNKRFSRLHLHSKMVLTTTAILLVSAFIFFFITERNNPGTLGGMPLREAVYADLYLAVMPRSGGMSAVDQSSLTGVSKLFSMILMYIGGSPGSTAGGIKNVCAGILLLSAVNTLRGKKNLSAFKKNIPNHMIVTALSITITSLTICLTGAVIISVAQPDLPFTEVLFETVSAVSICGLSHGITPSLTAVSNIVLIVLMIFGRLGIMTLGMAAFFNRAGADKIKRPDDWVLLG